MTDKELRKMAKKNLRSRFWMNLGEDLVTFFTESLPIILVVLTVLFVIIAFVGGPFIVTKCIINLPWNNPWTIASIVWLLAIIFIPLLSMIIIDGKRRYQSRIESEIDFIKETIRFEESEGVIDETKIN